MRGGALKIFIPQNQQEGGGGSEKVEPLVRGAAKISSSEFQYLHPPAVIINELSLKTPFLASFGYLFSMLLLRFRSCY